MGRHVRQYYHGTTLERARAAEREGLRPDPSHGRIYFTTYPIVAEAHAYGATERDEEDFGLEAIPAVLRIRVTGTTHFDPDAGGEEADTIGKRSHHQRWRRQAIPSEDILAIEGDRSTIAAQQKILDLVGAAYQASRGGSAEELDALQEEMQASDSEMRDRVLQELRWLVSERNFSRSRARKIRAFLREYYSE